MPTRDEEQALRESLREAVDACSSEEEKEQALLGVLRPALDKFSQTQDKEDLEEETQDKDLDSKQLSCLQALAGLVEEGCWLGSSCPLRLCAAPLPTRRHRRWRQQ